MEGCLIGPGPAAEQDFEELPGRRPRPWRETVLSLPQLTSYMNILTGRTDLNVRRGQGEAHVGTGTVYLPVGTLEAGETAAHEAGHINDPGASAAWRLCHYQGKAHEMVLEFLRDGYVEWHMGIESPGLHTQWQWVNDDATEDLLNTEWIPQSLIGIYLIVGGYEFPEDKLKPKARRLLAEFRSLGYVDEARTISAEDCARNLVPKVIDLFNVPVPPPAPQKQPPTGPGPCKGPSGQGGDKGESKGGQQGESGGDQQGNQQGNQQGQGGGQQGNQGQDNGTPKGADANSLLNNATRAANKIQKIENAKAERAQEAVEDYDSGGYRPVPKGGGSGGGSVRGNVPKPLENVGDMKEGESRQSLNGQDLSRIFEGGGGKGGNGIGYSIELAHNITIVDRSR